VSRVEFRVYGTPKPQGSKRHVGNGVMVESGGEALRTWREDVKQAALAARAELDEPLAGPVDLRVTFYLARPLSHWRTGRNAHMLRDSAPDFPWRRPDLDKLLRSTFDAISAAELWHDDCCAVHVAAWKTYAHNGTAPGAHITLEALNERHTS
jgi:crossover junction endodeoxyribonuclease RusA